MCWNEVYNKNVAKWRDSTIKKKKKTILSWILKDRCRNLTWRGEISTQGLCILKETVARYIGWQFLVMAENGKDESSEEEKGVSISYCQWS